MKVVFHKRYKEVYSSDPAAKPGRMESIHEELYKRFDFVEPNPAKEGDLRLVHKQTHIDWIKRIEVYDHAALAAGGAILASEIAMEGEPAFGLIRPPGHHASPRSSWGFCFFNNVAISIEKLRNERRIKRALIIDIDLHYGDGTANIFRDIPEVSYHHVGGRNRVNYKDDLRNYLDSQKDYEIIAVSAGFDRHEEDWGGLLKTEDYREIGSLIKRHAKKVCNGRRFSVLEGGYNLKVLGKNVLSFLLGME